MSDAVQTEKPVGREEPATSRPDGAPMWVGLTWLVYIIIWDGGLLAAAFWLVYKGHSGWWVLGALIVAAFSYQPGRWRKLWRADGAVHGDCDRDGHSFEARYDYGEPNPRAARPSVWSFLWGDDASCLEAARSETYVHDICQRCGLVIKRDDSRQPSGMDSNP